MTKLCTLFALVLWLGGSAFANTDPTNEKVGRLHFQAGEDLYRAGRYNAALAEFKKGFSLTGRPAFLLNIAQCERKLENLDAARESLAGFLEADPDSPLVPEARSVLAEIDAALKKRAEAGPKKVTPVNPPTDSSKNGNAELILKEPIERAPTPVYKKWWLWTAVGVVAVGVGLGVGLGVGFSSRGSSFPSNHTFSALNQQ